LHLNIAFDRYAAVGTVMHYILVISEPVRSGVALATDRIWADLEILNTEIKLD